MTAAPLPEVVTAAEWTAARERLLVKEKAALRQLDAVNAERRRLPMVRFDKPYVFTSPAGESSLLDLFEGRRQLITYHFMMFPGDPHRCPGCSLRRGQHGPPRASARARHHAGGDRAGADRGERAVPAADGLDGAVVLDVRVRLHGRLRRRFRVRRERVPARRRRRDAVYRTYFTTDRGADLLDGTLRYLDLTPFGRQEAWEESGRGNDPASSWWRLHDEY